MIALELLRWACRHGIRLDESAADDLVRTVEDIVPPRKRITICHCGAVDLDADSSWTDPHLGTVHRLSSCRKDLTVRKVPVD